MAKVVGVLKHASAPLLTKSGEKSASRPIDPQDTKVEVIVDGKPQECAVLAAVRKYCEALAAKKAAEDEAGKHAEVLRAFVGEVRTENAIQGDYQKTYRVVGEVGKVDGVSTQFQTDVSQADKWSCKKGVDLDAVRRKVGATVFDEVAEQEEEISIAKEILANRKERKEFSKALLDKFGVEGIKKYFKRDVVWVVKDGMDKLQYTLPNDQKAVLEQGFTQAADSVKDVSQKV